MARDARTLGLFDPPPAQPKLGDGLRWYQEDAVQAAQRSLQENRSALIVMATALGKTQVFSAFIRRWPGRVLVLAHRSELIDQASARLMQMTGEFVEVEQGPLRSGRARIVVGSIQTVYREDRLERLERLGGFTLIVVDEAHHYVSRTYKLPLERFAKAKILGVTATPKRSDAKALGRIFDDVCYTMGIRDGVDHGYLSPLRGREVEVTEVNLDSVATKHGDFVIGQLDEELVKGAEGVAQSMIALSGTRQGVVFLPGVMSARMTAARMNALKPGCAASVDGETDKDERRGIVERFRDGRLQFLANCMVATEGFDAPLTSVVGLARPTMSTSLYEQMIGRGLRVLPGVVDSIPGRDDGEARRAAIAASSKPFCTLIDFAGNNTKHDLVSPVDILGGRYDDDVRARAKKMAKENPGAEKDVDGLLEAASKDVERERMEAAARSYKAQVKSVSREFNPLSLYKVDEQRERQHTQEYGYKPPSAAQLNYLLRNGWTRKDLRGMSSRMVSRLIGEMVTRKKKGLMTKVQAEILARHGITTDMPAKVASQAIKYAKATGGKVDPTVLRQMVSGEEF